EGRDRRGRKGRRRGCVRPRPRRPMGRTRPHRCGGGPRVGKIEDLADCDVVVLSAGQGRKPEMTRLDLLHANAGLVAKLSEDIARAARRASLVVLTNPMDVMTTVAWQSTGWPRTRVLGSGTLLDSQRLRMILADHLNVPSVQVPAPVLGKHGDQLV